MLHHNSKDWYFVDLLDSLTFENYDCNGIRYKQHLFLEKFIRERFADAWSRINFLGVNERIVYSGSSSADASKLKWPNRSKPMLSSDGLHLMERRVNTTVPVTLWAEANILLNFLCNQVFQGSEEEYLCCVTWNSHFLRIF